MSDHQDYWLVGFVLGILIPAILLWGVLLYRYLNETEDEQEALSVVRLPSAPRRNKTTRASANHAGPDHRPAA